MRYSVWNTSTKSYDVYASDIPPMARIQDTGLDTGLSGPGHVLGFPPKEEIGILPSGSKYLGSSDGAQGQIVFGAANVIGLFGAIVAIVLANWIYDKFTK